MAETVVCTTCGVLFERSAWKVKTAQAAGKLLYCTPVCAYAGRQTAVLDGLRAYWADKSTPLPEGMRSFYPTGSKEEWVEFSCSSCGKPCTRPAVQARRRLKLNKSGRLFCGRACASRLPS